MNLLAFALSPLKPGCFPQLAFGLLTIHRTKMLGSSPEQEPRPKGILQNPTEPAKIPRPHWSAKHAKFATVQSTAAALQPK